MTVRQLTVIAAVAFAVLSPAVQAIADIGLSPSEFSRPGDETLRAAGYAFSIWSLIYAGLVGYAIWQALPRNLDSALLQAVGWSSAVSIAGTGAWIWASALDARWATVVIILVSAVVLIAGLLKAARNACDGMANRLLVWWPLGLLAGWLTIASALNMLTVATAQGLIGAAGALPAGLVGIALVTGVALMVLRASRLVAYGVPIVWGLIAVWAAERNDQPIVAATAMVSAVAIGLVTVWVGRTTGARR